jgi:cell division protein FtsW (lipid II flippase)
VTDTLAAFDVVAHPLQGPLDLGLACGLIALGVTGVVMIYSATRQALINASENPHYYLERQGLFVGLGVVVMYVVS